MTAAIYARKSTDQSAVADEQKSVARQIEHARQYATSKGWTVADEHIYVDDGISGAEFANRPGFLRLMNSLKPRAAFQVLVMSEESRLGREAIETAYALKQLVQAGVRVFFYLENRERTLDSPTDKIMLSLAAFADELEREKARQRTYDAMVRKAKAGHVTGGRMFGYDNVEVTGANGERSHVTFQINDDEATVVRQIFALCGQGVGLKGITKQLNEARALAPRRRGRPSGWAPSSIREILHREQYRGRRLWNVTRKRDVWGQENRKIRPERDWLSIDLPELRIVPEALWLAAHARLDARVAAYRGWCQAGKPAGGLADGRGVRTKYFLTGFGRCSHCGGSMQAVSSSSRQTGERFRRYVCATYWNRGASICPNGRTARMADADTGIAELLATEVLKPARLERALERAVDIIRGGDVGDRGRRAALQKDLGVVEAALTNLMETAAKGGAIPVVLDALAKREQERLRLVAQLTETKAPVSLVDSPRALRAQLRGYIGHWTRVLDENRAEARSLLGVVLTDRIRFEAVSDGDYQLHVPIAFDRILTAAVPAIGVLQERVMTRAGIEPATL